VKQITLCKCSALQGNVESGKLNQDLKVHENDANLKVETGDAIEVENLVSVWANMKLAEIENNIQKPFKLKLGKNKLPQVVFSFFNAKSSLSSQCFIFIIKNQRS
jgi:hypothetical protein